MEWMQWIWIGIALLLMIAQIFIAGQSLLIVGVGAVLAALLALGGIGVAWQLLIFIFVGAIGLLYQPRADVPTGATQETVFGVDRLVGQEGVVITTVDPERMTGRVLVDHEMWKAYSDTGEAILDGTRVFILAVQADQVRVRPVPNEPPPRVSSYSRM